MLSIVALISVAAPQLPQEAFDEKLKTIFLSSGVPGMAVGVIRDGKLVYKKALGVADVAKQTPLSADMPFEIGSLSKQFVGMCVLMLVNEGKLKLDEKLGDLVPDLPEKWRDATLDITLHHMSGVPDYQEITNYDFFNKDREPKEIIASASAKQPEFKPGEKFHYSNTGYFLVSLAIEKRSGMPFSKFLASKIFKPLGMDSTYTEGAKPADMPTGYQSRTGPRIVQPPVTWSSTMGAFGIVSTLSDLAKWDAALYTNKLLPDDLRKKLWEETKTVTGTPVNYGYGWLMSTYRGFDRQWHAGKTTGFTCIYNRFPSLNTSVIAFANAYEGSAVFPFSNAALVHCAKEMNYLQMPVPEDPDPARTAKHLKDVRAAILAEGDLSVLSPGMKELATNERFAKMRDASKKKVTTSKSFKFVRKRTFKEPVGEIEDYLYRLEFEGGEQFCGMRYSRGLLISLVWEDE